MKPWLTLPSILALAAGCPSDERCGAVQIEASQHVLDAIGDDQPCTVDEDCEVVSIAGSCFDSCTRVIASANHDLYEQALGEAEADICPDFAGCTLIIPPCAPPDPAVCGLEGWCEGG